MFLGLASLIFFNLPNEQIVAIALQCANPNVYLSIAILYVTLQSAGAQQIDLALSMPILFTIYGTVITIVLGIYLKKYKFITLKKHKRLKKLSNSFISKFRKDKGMKMNGQNGQNGDDDILKSVSSSSSSEDNEDPIQVFKQKCQSLFKEMPESFNQPQKIMEYQNAHNGIQRDEADEQMEVVHNERK